LAPEVEAIIPRVEGAKDPPQAGSAVKTRFIRRHIPSLASQREGAYLPQEGLETTPPLACSPEEARA
jgi:hypothetical protein